MGADLGPGGRFKDMNFSIQEEEALVGEEEALVKEEEALVGEAQGWRALQWSGQFCRSSL